MHFMDFSKSEFKIKRPGVFVKVMTGEKMQLCHIKLNPGVITHHVHIQEQMGFILSGSVELTVGKEKKICGPGEAYYIPSDIEHGFRVLTDEPLEYVEVFSPPKEENLITE